MNQTYNLILVFVFSCVLAPPSHALSDIQEGEPSLEVINEKQEAITESRFATNRHELRILEYQELSNTCREIYKEHLSSLLTLVTVGAAILGYAISSKITRRMLIFAAAVSLGLCWFAVARHIHYSCSVRAPMEYRLYNLERELGIKVWRTSHPLMVYMWEQTNGEPQHIDEIGTSTIRNAWILRVILYVFLVVSAISIICLLAWAAFFPSTNSPDKLGTGEPSSGASKSV